MVGDGSFVEGSIQEAMNHLAIAKGKTVVWTSDIGPHWVSKEFLNWEGYSKLWNQIFHWMAK